METKNVIFELRTKSGLSQDELAEKVFVTRQAVSRWENGETTCCLCRQSVTVSAHLTALPLLVAHCPYGSRLFVQFCSG